MSQQQQKDTNNQVVNTANTQTDKEYGESIGGDKTNVGDITEASAVAVGTGATATYEVTNNYYYGSEPSSGKVYTLTLDKWRTVSCAILQQQNRTGLTTNPRTNQDGISFALNDIYVPLELVERKQRLKHSSEIRPEQSSLLYVPEKLYKADQLIQDNDFFDRILYQGQSEKSKGERIAIIGESGAGKTTLLQKIADWLLNTHNQIVIWVSLSNLQNKTLKQYLEEDWLEAALPYISSDTANVNQAIKDAFAQLFNNGRVWLLLDGVDEINVSTVNPLNIIAQQLTSWVAKARVVVTCRLNIWDTDNNPLERFDTFRTREFTTPEQVENFVSNWLKKVSNKSAKQLQMALKQDGRERLQDLVRNPLRLALLCRIWQSQEGALPETKAQLYNQYVEAIYKWELKQLDEALNEQELEELNLVLGQLALQAIDRKDSRFCLRESLVREVLEKPHPKLFNLALRLGWINKVGETIEKPKENVYAFLHATFQEYFAAQAIKDWRYFLNYTLDNPEQSTYRIFCPHWKEVILLWLEQPEARVSKEQKQEFIETLVDYKDRYQGENIFYTCTFLTADCLVAAGLTEHKLYDIIRQQIVQIYLKSSYKLLREQAFETLKRFSKNCLISVLEKEIEHDDKHICLRAVKALGELATDQALEVITNKYLNDGENLIYIINALINANNVKSIEMLQKILNKLGEDGERSLVSVIVSQLIETNKQKNINLLIDVLQHHQTPDWMQTNILQQLGSINSIEIKNIFVNRLKQAKQEKKIHIIIELLNFMKFSVNHDIAVIIEDLLKYSDKSLVLASISFLSQQQRISFEMLMHLLDKYQNEEMLQIEILKALIRLNNIQAEKIVILIFKEKYELQYLHNKILDLLGEFGGIESCEYLSQQLRYLSNDYCGNQQVEAAIIKSLYHIYKRLPHNQRIKSSECLCQNILQHLQLSTCDDEAVAKAAVYFLFKIGSRNYIEDLLKLAQKEKEILIEEALLRHLNEFQINPECKDLIINWVNERVLLDNYMTKSYFGMLLKLINNEDIKLKLISVLEGDRPLLIQEALELAKNVLNPEEMLYQAKKFLHSSEPWAVDKAIEIFGKVGDDTAIQNLLPMIKNQQYQQKAFKALFDIAERCLLLEQSKLKLLKS